MSLTEKHLSSPAENILFEDVSPGLLLASSVHDTKYKKKLLQHLNSQHPRIKFTLDEEEVGRLPFMDVSSTRQLDGSLTRQVYQKSTHTNRYVLFSSHHPTKVKEGIVRGLADRAIKVCNDGETLDGELNVLRRPWKEMDIRNNLQRR